jgi:hypothetical protein
LNRKHPSEAWNKKGRNKKKEIRAGDKGLNIVTDT